MSGHFASVTQLLHLYGSGAHSCQTNHPITESLTDHTCEPRPWCTTVIDGHALLILQGQRQGATTAHVCGILHPPCPMQTNTYSLNADNPVPRAHGSWPPRPLWRTSIHQCLTGRKYNHGQRYVASDANLLGPILFQVIVDLIFVGQSRDQRKIGRASKRFVAND